MRLLPWGFFSTCIKPKPSIHPPHPIPRLRGIGKGAEARCEVWSNSPTASSILPYASTDAWWSHLHVRSPTVFWNSPLSPSWPTQPSYGYAVTPISSTNRDVIPIVANTLSAFVLTHIGINYQLRWSMHYRWNPLKHSPCSDLCYLIKLLQHFLAYFIDTPFVTLSPFDALSNFFRLIELLSFSHPLLSIQFLRYLRTCCTHRKHNTLSRLNVRTLSAAIHFSNSPGVVPSCHSDYRGSRHGWGFSRRTTSYFPAEIFTRWDVLWNHQTNANPDE